MARYMTLAPIFIQPLGTASARTVQPGTEIDYDGGVNPTLFPLCPAARAAHAHLLAKRNPQQRVRYDIVMRRGLRGLPRHLRMKCEKAAAEAIQDSGETIAAPVQRKSSNDPATPATYPGAWKSQAGKAVGSAILKAR